ncbi:MAG: GntR family transcriptional regulator, partial [Peptostreptococcaceae bacterium]
KYFFIKNDIINKIKQKTLIANQLLPSERELIDEYNVSRITVRRAIDELVKDGYAYKIRGKGSFVKGENLTQGLNRVSSYTEEILNHGMNPSRHVINAAISKMDNVTAEIFNMNVADDLFILKRVYYADNEPICITETMLPYSLFPKIECFDFTNNSLYSILENFYDLKITKAKQNIEATISDEYSSNYLKITNGYPLLLFQTTTYGLIDGDEIPFEYFKSYYNSNKFKYSLDQIR